MNSSDRESPGISVRNLQRSVKVGVAGLKRFVRNAVRLCLQLQHPGTTDLQRLRHISILIVSDRRMESLHRQFLNETGPTDVLTFQHGEIFISAQTARRNARGFGSSLEQELRLYVVHGLLHLHGLDDRNAAEKRKMVAIQSTIFERASSLN
jgi:probable rRNA maturation factor